MAPRSTAQSSRPAGLLARARRPLAAVAALALSAGLGATTPAASAPLAASPAAAGPESGPARMMLVLDSSGSMKEQASGGQTRIHAAKDALGRTIKALPADQEVGLRVYGSKVFSAKDAGACTDSTLEVPLGTDNRAELKAAVASYKPYGETPIGYALQQAGKDLGNEGNRTIILVSDGVPTCEPDPCVVAAELAKQGINLRIDVVGLDVDSKARDALRCIARAGGGTYYDAAGADDLASSLNRVTERAARGFVSIGTPVLGTPEPTDAPEVTAGDWSDQLPLDGGTKHYRVTRHQPGSTLVASASWRSEALSLATSRLTTPEGTECDLNTGQGEKGLVTSTVQQAPFKDPSHACSTADELVLSVEYSQRLGTNENPLMELRITELPPVSDADTLPAPSPDTPAWTAPAAGQRQPVTGGVSFADAQPLEPGSYSGEIVPGEILTFTVDTDWGQSANAEVAIKGATDAALRAADGTTLKLAFYSPGRGQERPSFTSPSTTNDALVTGSGARAQTTSGALNLNNLTALGWTRNASLAGLQYLVVFAERTQDPQSVPLPYTLDLGVSGEVAGTPTFVETSAPATPSDSPSTPQGPAGPGSTEPTPVEPKAAEDGTNPMAWVAGGAGALALAAGAVLLVRRRRPGTGGPVG